MQASLGELEFSELQLDGLLVDDTVDAGTELKEWDASEITMHAMFLFRAPIALQAKVRDVLRREFPGASFEEETIHE